MAIGERIHFFRTKKKLTMKQLGQAVGFPENSADVRLAQYETGTRSPKADLTAALAHELDVCPEALAVPDIDSQIGLMHTLFALHDIYGLTVDEVGGEPCLRVDREKGKRADELLELLSSWQEQKAKAEAGEISSEDYERWCRHFPKYDTDQRWGKAPSQQVSDAMVEAFKDRLKIDE